MGGDSHLSIYSMLLIIFVMALMFLAIFLGFVPKYVGKIVAEAGNVSKLNINQTTSAIHWDGLYGNLTTVNLTNEYNATGGAIVGRNITVPHLGIFLDPTKTVFISTQPFMNISNLVPASPAEVDAYLNVPASAAMSGTSMFKNQTNFTIDGHNYTLNSTYSNSPNSTFDLGLLKDNSTSSLFFVSHIVPGGTAFNNEAADYQLMTPVKEGTNPTYYIYYDDSISCVFQIPFVAGQNWFSIPCQQSNMDIKDVMSSLGNKAGIQHEVWPMAGCTGNATDNFDGNYTVIWFYNASDTADPWKDYNPGKPCFQIPNEKLNKISSQGNYQIIINSSNETLDISGSIHSTTQIPVVLGVNWVGFPASTRQPVESSLRSLGIGAGIQHEVWPMAGCTGNANDNFDGNYTVIWTYNASDTADPWKDYNPGKPCFQIPNEKIKYLSPGSGYQINLNVSSDTMIIHNI